MRLAQIENGVVVNVIEVDPEAIPEWAADWPEAGDAGPGWLWDGESFTPPEPPPVPVPEAISPLQARVALMQASKLDAVEQIVAGADPLVQVAWEYATELRRHSPTIEMLREQAGWSPEEMDTLFIAAAKVEF